jgi:1,4-alpha-glucan branching enzyme
MGCSVRVRPDPADTPEGRNVKKRESNRTSTSPAPGKPGFALVLHTHLPFVLNHGRWPHGSDWLNEATVECYLPLLDAARRLVAEGISPRWTINISPILAEQLASSAFQKEIEFFIQTRLRFVEDNRSYFRKTGQDELVALTHYWEENFERVWGLLRGVGGDIVGAFAELGAAGHLEIITCAATHGYLPLLSRDESIHLQLRTAVESHTRHFGRRPRGIWLPECAYRPRYEWAPPVGAGKAQRGLRPGLEELLAEYGIEFFIVDSHLVRSGAPLSAYRDFFPALAALPRTRPVVRTARPAKAATPYRPYRVASRGGKGSAIAFVRDPRTTVQVWSRDQGYPGEPQYLEFHKKHFPGGFRYWRVTGSGVDLGDKQLYNPAEAAERVQGHADHFLQLIKTTLADAVQETGGAPPVVVSPYDAELFGHWWFEGPMWLEAVARRMAADGVRPVTLAEVVDAGLPAEVTTLQEGSWGEGGDHRVWLNRETEWTWDRVYDAEQALVEHIRKTTKGADAPLYRRVLAQACREALLLQASDWQFLITTQSARDYAERRFAEHYAEFKRLLELCDKLSTTGTLAPDEEEALQRLEVDDFPFPDLDPAWAAGRSGG